MTYAGLDHWPEPPIDGVEVATLLGSLDRQRATFAWKVSGLDESGMRARVGRSTMTLGGLLTHLAHVEDHYFSVRLFDNPPTPPWDAVDADDADWTISADASPASLQGMWQAAVDRSRALVAEAIASGGLGQPVRQRWPDGRAPSLRRTLIDMIEEYARHVGHADLLRESVDGLVGEDPPGIRD